MNFKIHSYILHPQILGTDCKIYIDCENARKLKNKLEEYQNNKIWFNIKKFLRLKRYLNILNNYLFILYTKMYKNVKENKENITESKIKILDSERNEVDELIKSMQTEQTEQTEQTDDEKKHAKKNYYTEFSGVFRTLLFGNVFDFINFWAFNVYKLCDIIDDNNKLKNILNNYITKKQLNTAQTNEQQLIDSIKAIYTKNYESNSKDFFISDYELNQKIKDYNLKRIKNLIESLNKVKEHITEITEYIKKIDEIINTKDDNIKKTIIENNNPIFDDLNDYANNGDIIEVSVYRKGLRLNYKGCITQINVKKKTFVVTSYSNFSKKLYIGEYNFATELCIKNETDYDNCIKFINYTPKQISIMHDFRKFIFDTGTYSNELELNKYCKIFINIHDAIKLINKMKEMKEMKEKFNIPNSYTSPYEENKYIHILIKNDSLLKSSNSYTRGFITGFDPIKHNFSIIYYPKFRPIEKDFNFNKLCITNFAEIPESVRNDDTKNDDIKHFDEILESVLKDEAEKMENIKVLIRDKNKKSMLIKKIFNLIKQGLIMLAIAAVLACIIYLLSQPATWVFLMNNYFFIPALYF